MLSTSEQSYPVGFGVLVFSALVFLLVCTQLPEISSKIMRCVCVCVWVCVCAGVELHCGERQELQK